MPSSKEVNPPLPAGIGAGRPVHPFAVTVEDPVAVRIALSVTPSSSKTVHSSMCADSSVTRMQLSQMDMESNIMHTTLLPKASCQSYLPPFSHYYTNPGPGVAFDGSLTAFSLPTGTSLPGGAVLPMSSVADFPMNLPQGWSTRH